MLADLVEKCVKTFSLGGTGHEYLHCAGLGCSGSLTQDIAVYRNLAHV